LGSRRSVVVVVGWEGRKVSDADEAIGVFLEKRLQKFDAHTLVYVVGCVCVSVELRSWIPCH
jgi:uncharacterized protein (UPF0212 family)